MCLKLDVLFEKERSNFPFRECRGYEPTPKQNKSGLGRVRSRENSNDKSQIGFGNEAIPKKKWMRSTPSRLPIEINMVSQKERKLRTYSVQYIICRDPSHPPLSESVSLLKGRH